MMEGWKEYKIKDVCQIVGGYAFKSKDFKKEGDIPIVKIKSLKDRKIDISDSEFVDKSFLGLNEKYHVNYNDYIIALTGSHITLPSSAVGRVSKSNHKIALLLNQRVGKFIVDEKLCSHDFLYYFLNTDSFFHNIGLRAKGAANQANISTGDVGDIKINLPPLPTQHKIASILSAYDDLIENNLQRIKLLEEMAQQTYTEWFVRMKFPGHESVERDDETELPEGWERKIASKLFNIKIGKTPPRGETHWFNTSKSLKWISIRDMRNSNLFIFNTNETIDEKAISKFNFNVAKKDTVILSFKLTVGLISIVTENMVTNEAIAHFNTTKISPLSKEYTYLYLKSFNYDTMGSTSSIGTAINSKIVKRIPILVPDVKTLLNFNTIIEPVFKSIKNLQTQNQLLKEARDILLPRLMTGMIEV